jgi:UDPglucose 6-dehydrogenase
MIGTGYVGLVSGVCFSDLGNTVYCVDNNTDKIDLLNSGKVPIYEPGLDEILKKNHRAKRLIFTNDLKKAVSKSDIIFICVGTPTIKNTNSADLKYVFNVTKELKKIITKYKIVVTKSTVPVTTGDKIEKILSNLKNKNLVDVVSNPEFLREGEAIRDFIYPDRVIIGTNSKKANKIMNALYMPIVKKKSRYFSTSRRGAELIKYASNAFLATKITYINELANLCEKTGVDIKDIAFGMGSDERIGGRFLRAGPAYGGSCFPKDTRALIDTANQFKTDLSIVKSVVKSNDNRKTLLTKKLETIMNNRLKNKVITFLGVTFKPNTDDMREASSVPMIKYLNKKKSIIRYYDPSGKKGEFKKLKNVKFFKDIPTACLNSDLVVLHTEWNDFKILNFKKLIKKKNFKIFDMRNIYSPTKMKNLKINYFGIGR